MGAYVIHIDEYANIVTHWIALKFQIMLQFILIVLGLNMFLKKIKSLLEIKTFKQIYLEYKQIIQ